MDDRHQNGDQDLKTDEIVSLCERFEKLYTPAVADALDRRGLWNQILESNLTPLRLEDKVAGPAFTAKGHPTVENNTGLGASVLEGLTPGCIAVWDTSGDMVTGHWGELMSNSAISKGCRGAIVDGGIRDTGYILPTGFPVWSKFRSPADALGRWKISEVDVPVRIGGVLIFPGDFIFADCDGVVVVPERVVEEVLQEAEEVMSQENQIRDAVHRGEPLANMYEKFKSSDRPGRR